MHKPRIRIPAIARLLALYPEQDYIERYFLESEYDYDNPRPAPEPLRRKWIYPS
jgi:hypothetical protein